MLKNIALDTKGPLAPHHHLALIFGNNETFSPAWPDHLPQGTCTCPPTIPPAPPAANHSFQQDYVMLYAGAHQHQQTLTVAV